MTREYLIIIAVSDSPTEVTNHEISSYFDSNPIVEDLTATSYHAWSKGIIEFRFWSKPLYSGLKLWMVRIASGVLRVRGGDPSEPAH